ncbi:hypothetical protein IscW_ISCW007065 [Ixodes scapularis]|uniref:Uncharacterized protein n=1 Tax=Ixodes scapularis TaxID=6945 RepID=B7PRN5_IXOSC|nr:hypothetical protein IscW_ISCW007065 [Ixodes scapularis]|eukprot:XP_002400535.1 hypothetical protein IscW_ISCW007065 [Ixodes scapularis]
MLPEKQRGVCGFGRNKNGRGVRRRQAVVILAAGARRRKAKYSYAPCDRMDSPREEFGDPGPHLLSQPKGPSLTAGEICALADDHLPFRAPS